MKFKAENHRVAGISHYENNIVRMLGRFNDDYLLPDEQLLKKYRKECGVYEYSFPALKPSLVPEPNNPFDPNAVRVDVNGIKIGYIKKGSCSHVKKIIADPNYSHCTIKIYGGNCKRLCQYEVGGDFEIEEVNDDLGAILTLYIKSDYDLNVPARKSSDEYPRILKFLYYLLIVISFLTILLMVILLSSGVSAAPLVLNLIICVVLIIILRKKIKR